MPEEINRRLCDHISSYLFTTSREAVDNLLAEGIPPHRISFVGNTMIDTLLRFRSAARSRRAAAELGLEGREYAVVTLHRPDNVDEPDSLEAVLEALALLSRCVPVVFPLHPRTRTRLASFGLDHRVEAEPGLILTRPLGYLEFISLVGDASLVLTDSGGIQEETTVLGVPCLTLRESTERPVTVSSGTNRVVGRDPERIVEEALCVLESPIRIRRIPERWDGRAGQRIVEQLGSELSGGLPVALGVG
jgi:UDP-N-acetylglucosamine 2-epimerase (non-hydrolysing)